MVFGAIPWSLGAIPKVEGLFPRRAIPWAFGATYLLGVRGYPLVVRGSHGRQGLPPGVRGYPLGVCSYAQSVRGNTLVVRDIPSSMLSFGLTTKDPSIETNKPDLYLEREGCPRSKRLS